MVFMAGLKQGKRIETGSHGPNDQESNDIHYSNQRRKEQDHIAAAIPSSLALSLAHSSVSTAAATVDSRLELQPSKKALDHALGSRSSVWWERSPIRLMAIPYNSAPWIKGLPGDSSCYQYYSRRAILEPSQSSSLEPSSPIWRGSWRYGCAHALAQEKSCSFTKFLSINVSYGTSSATQALFDQALGKTRTRWETLPLIYSDTIAIDQLSELFRFRDWTWHSIPFPFREIQPSIPIYRPL